MSGDNLFIDSNIFLRIIAKDDIEKLKDCEHLIEKISQRKIKAFTSSLVLAEVIWTCLSYYRLNKSQSAQILQGILNIKNLKIQDKHDPFLALEYYRTLKIKFIDCLIASNPDIASGKASIVSYDRDFDLLSIRRREPRQLL